MRLLWTLSLLLTLTGCGGPKEKPSISLYLALQRGDLNQVERHIKWGSDLNAPLPGGQPPLHMAAAAGRPAIARTLIKHGANPEEPDHENRTPLFRALQQGRTQVADLLLKLGAKMDADGMLRLLVLQQTDDRDVVAFLQERGADINGFSKGRSLLGKAIRLDNLQLVKLLVRAGADVNLAEPSGNNPLQLATKANNEDIIRFLVRHGATNNTQN